MVSPDTNITGIFQSDLVLQSAIATALDRIEANPDEIDYIFQSMVKDPITKTMYGQAQIDSFKHWFLNTNIPVAPAFRVSEENLPPIITFSLISSDETDQTLGDVHYIPQEDTSAKWPVVAGPFDPVSYSASSGIMQLPSSIKAEIGPGMILVDRQGNKYPIIECYGDNEISLEPGTAGDFYHLLLKSNASSLITTIESVFMREVYQVGVHCMGEPIFLIGLHNILLYALQKYKEELLEAREFERSVITNTDLRRNNDFGNELVFSRWLNISGYVKHIWAKNKFRKIEQVNVYPTISEVIISGVDDINDNTPVNECGIPVADPFAVRPQ
ncbi:MAG TPA: hypothetical protein VHD33_01755 [Legionellaceae bacterium]|nr:hypothetical protein [Legionellaceae bacterium]